MSVQKIKAGRVPGTDADNYIGDLGMLFYNESVGDLRIGDGVTVGGIPLTLGGGDGSGYVLPTASTTTKGGVKVDGTTIKISNQIISGFSGSYNDLTDKPTLVTSYTQLSDKPTLVTSYTQLSDRPTIPTNTTQLTNGAGFITSSSLSGYATEAYVTGRGYLTDVPEASNSTKGGIKLGRGLTKNLDGTVDSFSGSYNDLTDKPSLFGGSYNDLSDKPTLVTSYNDLTDKPTIPTDINQLTDVDGLLVSGGGGGTVIQRVENPYTFSIAGDDSTQREITNGNTVQFKGTGSVTVVTSIDGVVTINGSAVSSGSYNDLTDKPTIPNVGSFTFTGTSLGTADSSSIGITTSVDLYSDVTVGGDLLPNTSFGGNLGSADRQWKSLYVSTNTIFIGGVPLSIQGGELSVDGVNISSTIDYNQLTNRPTLFSGSYTDLTDKPTLVTSYNDLTDKPSLFSGSYTDLTDKPTIVTSYTQLTDLPTIPADISDLTDVTNLLGSASTGNVTFVGTTISTVDSSGITVATQTTFNSDLRVEGDIVLIGRLSNTNNEFYATEAFVAQAVNDLVGAAPAALDTLKELADALGNDENFATTILNAVAAATNTVRYDIDNQGLTETQQRNARTNIDAPGVADMYAISLIF